MATNNNKKRTLNSFFQPSQPKKPKLSESVAPPSNHVTYPFPVAQFPQEIADALGFAPEAEAELINSEPNFDLLYFKPYIPKSITKDVFEFLRKELFFYRVQYTIKRGGISTVINTPRFTTVFGVDDTACFDEDGVVVDAKTRKPVPPKHYNCRPRPIPECLDTLRRLTEGSTGEKFNFCLVNYYATGDDSISYHSDDERFLGPNPAIASFSLGITRDFLMKHKPPKDGQSKEADSKPMKWALGPGDMLLMRGATQANWLHSIPKRKGGEVGKGRINITFRRAMVRGGTENYYQYNVGNGAVYTWDANCKEMAVMK